MQLGDLRQDVTRVPFAGAVSVDRRLEARLCSRECGGEKGDAREKPRPGSRLQHLAPWLTAVLIWAGLFSILEISFSAASLSVFVKPVTEVRYRAPKQEMSVFTAQCWILPFTTPTPFSRSLRAPSAACPPSAASLRRAETRQRHQQTRSSRVQSV